MVFCTVILYPLTTRRLSSTWMAPFYVLRLAPCTRSAVEPSVTKSGTALSQTRLSGPGLCPPGCLSATWACPCQPPAQFLCARANTEDWFPYCVELRSLGLGLVLDTVNPKGQIFLVAVCKIQDSKRSVKMNMLLVKFQSSRLMIKKPDSFTFNIVVKY